MAYNWFSKGLVTSWYLVCPLALISILYLVCSYACLTHFALKIRHCNKKIEYLLVSAVAVAF